MKNKIKDILGICLVVCLIIFIFIAVIQGISNDNKRYELENQKMLNFINACTAEGKHITSVGNGITTKQYIVCNPK